MVLLFTCNCPGSFPSRHGMLRGAQRSGHRQAFCSCGACARRLITLIPSASLLLLSHSGEGGLALRLAETIC